MTDASASVVVQAFGGAAVALLGIFVLTVRPRTRASASFGVFAIGFGGYYVAQNVFNGVVHVPPEPAFWTLALLRVVYVVGVVALALVFPARIASRERGAVLAAVAATSILAAVNVAVSAQAGFGSAAEIAYDAGSALAMPALHGFLILLVGRYLLSSDAHFRRQVALTAAALTLVVGFTAGYGGNDGGAASVLHAEGLSLFYSILRLAIVVGLAGAWLFAMRGPDPRTARRLAWLTLSTALAGLALALPRADVGAFGVARILMTAVLAYAVLQHQLFGIDVKVRWTISRGTVAAAFVAVFFLASEGAQLVLGRENPYLGLVGAGALVFAMAPLQRAAERLAEKAVPVAAPDGARSTADSAGAREAAYRSAARRYLRDGSLTREEERELAHLGGELQIHAGRALAIRHELEDERGREAS